jgi:predicted nucleotide-binding protein
MDKGRVFISHSSSDETWAREFANSLQQRGLKVWFDSNAIHSGQSLTQAVEKGLRESSVIVLLVTSDTLKRPNLFFEIGAAMGMGKPLVPVVSKDIDPSTLPISLRGRRYLLKRSPDLTAEAFIAQADAYDSDAGHALPSEVH